ncbi:MAG: hypothetical protein HKN02_00730 [Rhodobacteraceae bacterium]|nr:hypothetical protein [Paracoccaceae bacterium]
MASTTEGTPANQSRKARQELSDEAHKQLGGNCFRFLAMVGTSTALMFGVIYLNSYSP